MHPGKKTVSSLITASSVVQGGNICQCMSTHCSWVQTSVQRTVSHVACTDTPTHVHIWVAESLHKARQLVQTDKHAFIPSCPKLSAEEHTYICVYLIWCMKTHTYSHPSFICIYTLVLLIIFAWVMDKGGRYFHISSSLWTQMWEDVCVCSVYTYCVHTHTQAHFYSYAFKNTLVLVCINTNLCVPEKCCCQEDSLQILRTVHAHQNCHPAFSNRGQEGIQVPSL